MFKKNYDFPALFLPQFFYRCTIQKGLLLSDSVYFLLDLFLYKNENRIRILHKKKIRRKKYSS